MALTQSSPHLGGRRVEGGITMESIENARYQALDVIQHLLLLVEDVPSTQVRLLLQAGLLDVASHIEDLSHSAHHRLSEESYTKGSTGEVA